MKKFLFVFFAVCCSQFTAVAQIQTNAGIQYLQGMQKDVSTDFYDLSNIYFLADSLSGFDAHPFSVWRGQERRCQRRP